MIKPEKAVEVLKGDFTNIKLVENESHSDIFTQAFEAAIKSLEMRCRKPVNQNICPYCGKLLSIHHNFCPDCGQALLWKSGECSECIHNSKNWDEEPCDGCCGNHSAFEQK